MTTVLSLPLAVELESCLSGHGVGVEAMALLDGPSYAFFVDSRLFD